MVNRPTDPEQGLELPLPGGRFAPAGQIVGAGEPREQVQTFPTGIPQEIQVRGEMDVGFEHVGVTFGAKGLVVFFFNNGRPACTTMALISAKRASST